MWGVAQALRNVTLPPLSQPAVSWPRDTRPHPGWSLAQLLTELAYTGCCFCLTLLPPGLPCPLSVGYREGQAHSSPLP